MAFGCKDGRTPESTTKFGCDVKTRLIQDGEFSKILWSKKFNLCTFWGYFIIIIPTLRFYFVIYQLLDFILKSPSTAIN